MKNKMKWVCHLSENQQEWIHLYQSNKFNLRVKLWLMRFLKELIIVYRFLISDFGEILWRF